MNKHQRQSNQSPNRARDVKRLQAYYDTMVGIVQPNGLVLRKIIDARGEPHYWTERADDRSRVGSPHKKTPAR